MSSLLSLLGDGEYLSTTLPRQENNINVIGNKHALRAGHNIVNNAARGYECPMYGRRKIDYRIC